MDTGFFLGALIGEGGGGAPTLRSGITHIQYGWQQISVNSKYGRWNSGTQSVINDASVAKVKEYVVDQLEDKYGVGVVEVCNAYPGGEGRYFNFVPGTTPATSEHNFPLMYEDNGEFEPLGFWIKSNSLTTMQLEYTEYRDG